MGHRRISVDADSSPLGWVQIGQDLDGEAADDLFGYSVSISDDGTIVAMLVGLSLSVTPPCRWRPPTRIPRPEHGADLTAPGGLSCVY